MCSKTTMETWRCARAMRQTNLVNVLWPRTPFRFLATFLAMCQWPQKCLALAKTVALANDKRQACYGYDEQQHSERGNARSRTAVCEYI